jgi:hypothetical protein
MSYAESTSVPVDRSRIEVEKILQRYGATEFFYGTSPKGEGIGFVYKNIPIKIGIPMPKTGSDRQDQQERRRLWRVLVIALKAKLELVDSRITSFEDEFLAQTCLPKSSGYSTVGDWAKEQIGVIIETGKMPKLLSSGMGSEND